MSLSGAFVSPSRTDIVHIQGELTAGICSFPILFTMSWNEGLYSETVSTWGGSIDMRDGVRGRRAYQSHRGSTVVFFPVAPSGDRCGRGKMGERPGLSPPWLVYQGQEVPSGKSRKGYWLQRHCSKEGKARSTWILYEDLQFTWLSGAVLFIGVKGGKNGSWRPWDISHAGLLPCTGYVPHPFSPAPLLKQPSPVVGFMFSAPPSTYHLLALTCLGKIKLHWGGCARLLLKTRAPWGCPKPSRQVTHHPRSPTSKLKCRPLAQHWDKSCYKLESVPLLF